jgi:hypothetical protein
MIRMIKGKIIKFRSKNSVPEPTEVFFKMENIPELPLVA